MNLCTKPEYTPAQRLSDADLGRLVREALREPNIARVEVYGYPGKERVDVVCIQRKQN